MTTTTPDTPPSDRPGTERPTVRDLRVAPRGVLPRQIQTWLMIGIALVIVLIILITGYSDPPERSAVVGRVLEPMLAPAERIRSYEQQLAQEELRQRETAARRAEADAAVGGATAAGARVGVAGAAPTPEAESLFADNVVQSRRPTGEQPFAAPPAPARPAGPMGEDVTDGSLALLDRALARMGPPPVAAAPATSSPTPSATALGADASGPDTAVAHAAAPTDPMPGIRLRLLEGTVIETTLINRLDGTFAGPVLVLVTTPVYSEDRQAVVIPAGARLIGSAAPVQAWGDSRLAVSFHRLVMPNGQTYTLNQFSGLNQIGQAGLRDQVNRHYLQVFGASLAIGALSGLAQVGTRRGFGDTDFDTDFRQSAGSSLATSAGRVLDRYLNVLPTITIREGYRIKVYLTNDLELPRVVAAAQGGLR
jgi:type IV secretory pathway VirB10-like protein